MAASFYHLLGVDQNANEREIRYAFRKQAKRFHPDRYTSAPPPDRRRAENRMADLNEAYAVLSTPPRRALYDRCRQEGRDFRLAELDSIPESPAERWAREQAEAAEAERAGLEYQARAERGRQLALQVFHNQVVALDDTVRWHETRDEYFDKVLAGRQARVRTCLHLKLLDQLDPDHLPGIVDYSKSILARTTASLIRSEFVYLLVGRRVERLPTLELQVAQHNASCWNIASPLAPRAYLAWADARDGVVHAPGVRNAWPHPSELSLRLEPLLA